jgi:hypothetical protein
MWKKVVGIGTPAWFGSIDVEADDEGKRAVNRAEITLKVRVGNDSSVGGLSEVSVWLEAAEARKVAATLLEAADAVVVPVAARA